MSAVRTWSLACDAEGCDATLGDGEYSTAREVRAIAKEAGWRVGGALEYCPEHRPARAAWEPRIPKEELRQCLAEGVTSRQIAERFGTHKRAVWVAKRHYGLATPAPLRFTSEEKERAQILANEGMPMTWIAEDLGRNADSLRQALRPGEPKDWRQAWAMIRHRPELLKLHYEFAPPSRT